MGRPLWILCIILILHGCDTPVAEDAVVLTVEFEWTEKSECSRISPPITVRNIPKETRHLQVLMADLDMPTYDHGGGVVAYDGVGAIPEGALDSYGGPCPGPGVEHTYEMTVHALDEEKTLVIGLGKAVRKYSR